MPLNIPKGYKSPDVIDRRNGEKPTLMDRAHDLAIKVKNDYNDSFPAKAPASIADIGPPTMKQVGDKKYPAYKKGGKIRRTGLVYAHKGETVIPAKRTMKAQRKRG